MVYNVKYKHPSWTFWRTLKRVKGDGFCFTDRGDVVQSRYFILEDNSRIEIPVTMLFVMEPNRFNMIREEINRKTGKV